MRNICIRKGLVVGVIVLFLGVSVQPSIGAEIQDKIEVEPKDYLFQTIIDIANNPDVQELFKEYGHDIFVLNYAHETIYKQVLFKNPRLLFSMLFNKPKMTIDYLDKSFYQGVELVNIIGEDAVKGIIQSIEIINPTLLEEIITIIGANVELNNKVIKLKEMNNELSSDEFINDYPPIICNLLLLSIFAVLAPYFIVGETINTIIEIFKLPPIIANFLYLLIMPLYIFTGAAFVTLWTLWTENCDVWPPLL